MERLLPTTLEMQGISFTEPKEENDSNGLNGGDGGIRTLDTVTRMTL